MIEDQESELRNDLAMAAAEISRADAIIADIEHYRTRALARMAEIEAALAELKGTRT